MPKQVLPSLDDFKAYCEMEKDEGFVFLTREQRKVILPYKKIAETFHGLQSNPKRKGLQAVLGYEKKPFLVLSLTTIDELVGAKDSDEGWDLIIDTRFPKAPSFYSFPIRRTKNFLSTLRGYAHAEKNRVETMPHCTECNTLLRIVPIKIKVETVSRKIMHRYSLFCPNNNFQHQKSRYHNFYSGMDPHHARFIAGKFKRYGIYVDKEEEEGVIREPDRILRARRKESVPKKEITYFSLHDGAHLE